MGDGWSLFAVFFKLTRYYMGIGGASVLYW